MNTKNWDDNERDNLLPRGDGEDDASDASDEGVFPSAFSDYLLNAFEAPLPLKEDGTIEIKVRNQLKREALPLLAKDLENLLQDATITTDGTSIFINFEIPPRGDNGALRFT